MDGFDQMPNQRHQGVWAPKPLAVRQKDLGECYPQCPQGGDGGTVPSVFLRLLGSSGSGIGLLSNPWS